MAARRVLAAAAVGSMCCFPGVQGHVQATEAVGGVPRVAQIENTALFIKSGGAQLVGDTGCPFSKVSPVKEQKSRQHSVQHTGLCTVQGLVERSNSKG